MSLQGRKLVTVKDVTEQVNRVVCGRYRFTTFKRYNDFPHISGLVVYNIITWSLATVKFVLRVPKTIYNHKSRQMGAVLDSLQNQHKERGFPGQHYNKWWNMNEGSKCHDKSIGQTVNA